MHLQNERRADSAESVGASSPAVTTPWTLFKHGVCYEGGFPFEWVDQVRSPELDARFEECIRLGKALAQAERALAAATETLLASGALGREAKKAAGRILHAVRKGRLSPVPDALANSELALLVAPAVDCVQRKQAFDAATQQLDSAFTQARRTANAALLTLQKAFPIRDSVLTTSPHFFSTGFDKQDDIALREQDLSCLSRPTRRRLAKLYMYLQRGATKTHVASRLGTVGFVHADRQLSRPVTLDGTGPAPKSHVFVSFWAVASLAKAAFSSAYLARELTPLILGCVVEDDGGFFNLLSGQRPVLSSHQRRLLSAIDGKSSAFQLASLLDVDIGDLIVLLRSLAECDLVDLGDTPPVTTHDPIDWLIATLKKCPPSEDRDRWLRDVVAIRTLASQMEGETDLDKKWVLIQKIEEAFATAVARSARRNAGKTYGDRLVFYEERESTFRCFLGAPMIDRLEEQVGTALDVCWAYGTLWQRHYQAISSLAFKAAANGRTSLPFLTFVTQLQSMAQDGQIAFENEDILDFQRRWSELVESRLDKSGSIAKLSRRDVEAFVKGFGLGRDAPLPSAHAGIDIFIEAADRNAISRGDYRIAIGEVGENIMGFGSQFYFHPDPGVVTHDLNALLRSIHDYRPMAMILPPRNHKGLIHQTFTTSGRFVFARSRSARPCDDLPLRDLQVFCEGGSLCIGTESGERFQMFHHHDELAHLWTFAPPRILLPPLRAINGYRPRIEIEDVCLQRAEVKFPNNRIHDFAGSDARLLLNLRSCIEERGIGSRVFVHVASEPKPVYVDLASPCAADVLKSLAKHGDDLRLVEMYPTREGLWNCTGGTAPQSRVLEMRLMMIRHSTTAS